MGSGVDQQLARVLGPAAYEVEVLLLLDANLHELTSSFSCEM
jgi:hypothetical protein